MKLFYHRKFKYIENLNMRYRIIQNTYYNEYGKVESDYYTIQIKRWWGWKTVTKPYYDGDEPVSFKSIYDAQKHVENCLLNKIPTSKWLTKVIVDSEDSIDMV